MKRREFKANFALIQDLIPVNMLISLLSQNYNKYEIAEELTVTSDLIDTAFKIYTQKGMI